MIEISLLVQGPDGIDVYVLQEAVADVPAIKETDSISFRVRCPNDIGEPKVFIQDHAVELNYSAQDGGLNEYTADFNRYLSNHFGVTSIALSFSKLSSVTLAALVNVYATKINKEQAEKILDYLSSKMSDVTTLCFSKTHIGSDSRSGESTDTLTKIDFSRKILDMLSMNRHRFAVQPCKRSVEALTVSNYEENTYITDRDISWLFQHLDQMYPAAPGTAKVAVNNRHYSISQIQRSTLIINTDLFENQVILSFLYNLKSFFLSVPGFKKKYNIKSPYKGYYNFDSILEKIEAPLMERRFREARTLLQQCNELIFFFQKHIPCRPRGTIIPTLTPQAKRFTHYERAFRLIDSWYKLGQPTWKGANYLFGLKSLDKLYEFFCLYKMADKFLEMGYKLTLASAIDSDRESGMRGKQAIQSEERITNYYKFESEGKVLELFYEPTIWGYSELSKAGELVDSFHSQTASKPYFTPDFVIRQDIGSANPTYFIFDSKYSSENQTKAHHLPAIIEKYYLKLKAISKDLSIDSAAVKLVYALIPKTLQQEYGYHGGPFNVYDKLASSPFFGFIKVTPDEERSLEKLLVRLFKPGESLVVK